MRKLDPDQRYIVDVFVRYARMLKLAKDGYCNFPTPPLLIIEGDAGSGKSELIRILSQTVEQELRKGGDNPDMPYLLRASYTGEAASNIKGQTLTSLFNLNFVNKQPLKGLESRLRDKKRATRKFNAKHCR